MNFSFLENLINTGASAISELTICYWIGDDIAKAFMKDHVNWNKGESGDKGLNGIESYLNELTIRTNRLLGKLSYKRKLSIRRTSIKNNFYRIDYIKNTLISRII